MTTNITNPNDLLQHLKRIEDKQDETLSKQDKLAVRIQQIHTDSKRAAIINGSIYGGLTGGMVAVAIELIKLKLGG
ncbi:hypothetical protein SALWKB12_1099 [Snodgrassella communis]|uniref:hypothetical protein n=1 Tax=Snodgrassella communis TaxID=2946699 RepID=UPI0004619476|nr:hypothetical protein [Snodgrassella communis]KDN12575.1 hypothetical protein SALWKB12_1099 [Snodgrassella communis]